MNEVALTNFFVKSTRDDRMTVYHIIKSLNILSTGGLSLDELITLLADLVIEEELINLMTNYKAQHFESVGLNYKFVHKYILSL